MPSKPILRTALAAAALNLGVLGLAPPAVTENASPVCAECVRAHMDKLAGETLHGRACGSEDEHAASLYIQAELEKAGLKGAFADGMRQAGQLETPRYTAALAVGGHRFEAGKDLVVIGEAVAGAGRLVRVTDAAAAGDVKGAVVFYDHAGLDRAGAVKLHQAGAALVVLGVDRSMAARWQSLLVNVRPQTKVVGVSNEASDRTFVLAGPDAVDVLRKLPAGASAAFEVKSEAPLVRTTYNVVAVIHGSDPDADQKAMLLSAHYDHLGVRGGKLYPGADDDASGTAAVMEFARILASGPKPRRTIYFGLFGCEEEGTLGATYFRSHPPTSIADLALNIEFEMIGANDPKRPNVLMLTGFERSNLGPTLVAHGAKIGPDMYPDQNFFQRSDNYALARLGVVAHTVSGWPVPPTYHDPSDTLEHIDFAFMNQAIGSMVEPIRWLANSDFKPAWNPDGKP